MRLLIPILLNCLLAAALFVLDRKGLFDKLSHMAKQVLIGCLFGCLSAFASFYGVELLGTVVNVRDAAPLCAGLIFGAPAGVISGVIGGMYRWISVAFGAGTFTRLACTIATILAGVMAAGLRKLVFDDRRPTWRYGICITVVCEVIHMLLIFLTNMDEPSYAFEFVRGATIPMIIGNAAAVGLALVCISLLKKEKLFRKKEGERIARTFQRRLLACILAAYLVTSTFTYVLQNGMVQIETKDIFSSAINDVYADVRGKSDDYMLEIVGKIKEQYEKDPLISLGDLAREYDVIEINIVSEEGLITDSTNEVYAGTFNMNSTAQSKEFMILTEGETSYVQEYGAAGRDGTTMRKYAGVSLENGGFLQVGYSTEQFHKMLDGFVIDVTKNRHVGSGGFLAVCDEELNLVTHTSRNGEHISTIGIEPNEEMEKREPASDLYKAEIINEETGKKEQHIYVFTFVEGYCILAAMPQAEAMFMRDASLYTSMFMQVLIFTTLFVFLYILIKRVILNNLKSVNTALRDIAGGNLDVIVDVRSNKEFSSLSDDINHTVDTLKQYIKEADARIDKELEYAKQIQLSALPVHFPDYDEYGIYAQMIAAKEVGGDFYDFYTLNDHTVAFLAADVSGKGIPAALFMMTAKTIIKDLAESGLLVHEIFTRANEKLCENNESGMFVTAWMGILDLRTGSLKYANAGHNPPLLMRDGSEFEYLRSRAGFVLAGMEGVCYRVNEIQLKPGDRLFLYTDGVTEATDTIDRLYGEERLLSFLNQNKEACAKALLPALKSDIDRFVGEAPQFDDITMLLFDYKMKKGV